MSIFYDSEKHLYLNSFPGAKSVNLHSINVLQTVLAGDGDFKSEKAAFGLIHTNGAFQSLAFQRTYEVVRRNSEGDGYRLNQAASRGAHKVCSLISIRYLFILLVEQGRNPRGSGR